MWSFSGMFYRNEQWWQMDCRDLLERLGATVEELAAIDAKPTYEYAYEAAFHAIRERIGGNDETGQTLPLLSGTWGVEVHRHTVGTAICLPSDKAKDGLCPCEPTELYGKVPVEECPWFTGREEQ